MKPAPTSLLICALPREEGTPVDFRQRAKLRRTHIEQFQSAVRQLADIDGARDDFADGPLADSGERAWEPTLRRETQRQCFSEQVQNCSWPTC